jgi:hypothetical protein
VDVGHGQISYSNVNVGVESTGCCKVVEREVVMVVPRKACILYASGIATWTSLKLIVRVRGVEERRD